MSFLCEPWTFMRVRKKYWLFPVMVTMPALGGLIVLSQTSAVAPMIYTIFLSAQVGRVNRLTRTG